MTIENNLYNEIKRQLLKTDIRQFVVECLVFVYLWVICPLLEYLD